VRHTERASRSGQEPGAGLTPLVRMALHVGPRGVVVHGGVEVVVAWAATLVASDLRASPTHPPPTAGRNLCRCTRAPPGRFRSWPGGSRLARQSSSLIVGTWTARPGRRSARSKASLVTTASWCGTCLSRRRARRILLYLPGRGAHGGSAGPRRSDSAGRRTPPPGSGGPTCVPWPGTPLLGWPPRPSATPAKTRARRSATCRAA
jgi:hypothetical protein